MHKNCIGKEIKKKRKEKKSTLGKKVCPRHPCG
jgi:hypothetical protein